MLEISRSDALSKGLPKYYTGTVCPHGHESERFVSNYKCCQCRKIYNDNDKENRKVYKLKNKKIIALKSKEFRDNNKEYVARKKKLYNSRNKEKRKAHYEKTKDDFAEYRRLYRLENKEKIAKSVKRWRDNNPLNVFTRRSLERIEKAKSKIKIIIAETEIGYTQQEFIEHIESLFEEGMTWCKRSEWHIDHIIPLSWWLNNGIDDVSIINALVNLQPLWAKDNFNKGSSL